MIIYLGDQPVIEAIEVLIAKKAYYVKRVGAGSDFHGPDQGLGQITWSLHGGPAGAWEVAKERSSFWQDHFVLSFWVRWRWSNGARRYRSLKGGYGT